MRNLFLPGILFCLVLFTFWSAGRYARDARERNEWLGQTVEEQHQLIKALDAKAQFYERAANLIGEELRVKTALMMPCVSGEVYWREQELTDALLGRIKEKENGKEEERMAGFNPGRL